MYLITWITTHLPTPEDGWLSWPRHAAYAALYNIIQDYIAARCEKLAQGFYTAATWPGIKPRICDTLVRDALPVSHRAKTEKIEF